MQFRAVVRVALGIYAVLLAACAASVREPPTQPVPGSSPEFSRQDKTVNLSKTYRNGPVTEVSTSYAERSVAANGNNSGYLGFRVKSQLSDRLPPIQAEVDYGSFDTGSSQGLDTDHRSLWIGSQSSFRGVQYGVSYQSMGRYFSPLGPISATLDPGKDRMDAWGRRQIGNLSIRGFAWHSKDQEHGDTLGPRYANSAVGTSLSYLFPSTPNLRAEFSYSRQTTNSFDEPNGIAPYAGMSHNVAGTLSLHRERWDATASSSYAYQLNRTGGQTDTLGTLTQSVSASYRPVPNLSISPNFTYTDAQDQESPSRTLTKAGSLGLSFHPFRKRFTLDASGSVSAQTNPYWNQDISTISTRAGISVPLPLGNPKHEKGALAFHVGYDRYSDATNLAANTGGFCLNLEMSLRQFD